MPRFVFQQSMIFDTRVVDPSGEINTIKARSEPKARRLLPRLFGVREWVLIEKKEGSGEDVGAEHR